MLSRISEMFESELFDKILKIFLMIFLLINILFLFLNARSKLFLTESPSSVKNPPVARFCYWGFNSILNKDCDRNVIKHNICEYLETNGYQIFDFNGSEKIIQVRQGGKANSCVVTLEDDKGLRAFTGRIDQELFPSAPHGYVVSNFEEVETGAGEL